MRAEFAEQYGCVCLVLDGNEKAGDVIERAYKDEATFFDGDDECLCLRIPGRPQELYTRKALIHSLGSNDQANRRVPEDQEEPRE